MALREMCVCVCVRAKDLFNLSVREQTDGKAHHLKTETYKVCQERHAKKNLLDDRHN